MLPALNDGGLEEPNWNTGPPDVPVAEGPATNDVGLVTPANVGGLVAPANVEGFAPPPNVEGLAGNDGVPLAP